MVLTNPIILNTTQWINNSLIPNCWFKWHIPTICFQCKKNRACDYWCLLLSLMHNNKYLFECSTNCTRGILQSWKIVHEGFCRETQADYTLTSLSIESGDRSLALRGGDFLLTVPLWFSGHCGRSLACCDLPMYGLSNTLSPSSYSREVTKQLICVCMYHAGRICSLQFKLCY